MKEKLKLILSRRPKVCITSIDRAPAAVLIPIYVKNGQYYVVLIRRTNMVKTHKGQIAFPGGAFEPGDLTLLNTALRESYEEIGLKAEDVEILGELDDHISLTSNYVISPFVGLVPYPYQFRVDGRETASLIEVPVLALLEQGCFHHEMRVLDDGVTTSNFYEYNNNIIWGATARILSQFLDVFAEAMFEKIA